MSASSLSNVFNVLHNWPEKQNIGHFKVSQGVPGPERMHGPVK